MFEKLKRGLLGRSEDSTSMGLGLSQSSLAPVSTLSKLRDALFADASLERLLKSISPEAKMSGPFLVFTQAAEARRTGNLDEAVALLTTLTEGQESRVKLYAWAALKEFGAKPPSERAKDVLGVIVEVAMHGGADMVAAYGDHTARYYNYDGAGVVWETDDPRLKAQTDALLEAGRKVVSVIGPWEQRRPEIPRANQVRLNMLTPSGLHFGEGPMDFMSRDQMGGPVIKAALDLMQALIAVDAEHREAKAVSG